MLIHTFQKALAQGPVSLTRHRIDLISRLVCAFLAAAFPLGCLLR